jgi:hypothetical protein
MKDSTFEKYKLVVDEYLVNGMNGTKAYQRFYTKSSDTTSATEFLKISRIPKVNQYIQAKMDSIEPVSCFNYNSEKTNSKGVYIVQCVGTTYFKIGKALNIDNRLSALQTGCPFELRVVSFIETDLNTEVEKHLHQKYSNNNFRGEWFHLGKIELQEIKELKDTIESNLQIALFQC